LNDDSTSWPTLPLQCIRSGPNLRQTTENDVTQPTIRKPFMDVLSGQRQAVPPIWMMRQAGRYLPEYRELRAKAGGFLDLCFTPEFAAEVTLQPIRRFKFDAAIIFSDILVVPYALGRSVRFEAGEGPRLDPLDTPDKIATLAAAADGSKFAPVYEALRRVRAELDQSIALIGFCGAPWTVATYMVAGQGTPDQAPARMLAYRHPDAFARIIDTLVESSITYLTGQLAAVCCRRANSSDGRSNRHDASSKACARKLQVPGSSGFRAELAPCCLLTSNAPGSMPSALTGRQSRL